MDEQTDRQTDGRGATINAPRMGVPHDSSQCSLLQSYKTIENIGIYDR